MPVRPENVDRYPENWAEISHRIRFVRAGGRCECEGECGRSSHRDRCQNWHGDVSENGRGTITLTTAHLDHTPENCDDANLRAYCNGCHLRYDREHHAQTAARTRREQATAGMEPLFREEAASV